ncbi:hypothetical protein B4Q13_18750, partial [Lacticaseibacillus rhamnosus]
MLLDISDASRLDGLPVGDAGDGRQVGDDLAIGHALLLLVDKYFAYTIADVLVPFIGPYRPLAVGLGTLSLWVMLAVSASFWIKDRLGHRNWWWLHLTSYVTFGLA